VLPSFDEKNYKMGLRIYHYLIFIEATFINIFSTDVTTNYTKSFY